MSQEPNTGTPGANKRGNRQGRNRPLLVTSSANEQAKSEQVQETGEASQSESTPTTPATSPAPSRRPKFFSTLARKEPVGETEEAKAAGAADPVAARLARAIRGKAAATSPKESKENKEGKKPEAKPSTSARSAAASATRPAGFFKMRYIMGMVLYLLIADILGVFEKSLFGKNDPKLLQLGPIAIFESTLLFLATLVALLIILARFDLIPRRLADVGGQSPSRSKTGQSQNASRDESGRMQPTMKQGVKGVDDDLYQEYREQQRYLQRRERKR